MEQTGKNSSLHDAKLAHTASGAHYLLDRLGGTTNRVVQRLGKTASQLKDTEQRLVGVSSNYVREHPLASAGIALAAGFLVSQLVGARKSPASQAPQLKAVENSGTFVGEG